MVKRLAKNISPTKETEAELVEHVVSEWCKMHHVDPKSHMAVMEGLRVLYMMREFDMTDRDELLKELLASDDAGPEAASDTHSRPAQRALGLRRTRQPGAALLRRRRSIDPLPRQTPKTRELSQNYGSLVLCVPLKV
ncbi:hypothetical protein ABIA23_002525 [Sinorhizobium fredii]